AAHLVELQHAVRLAPAGIVGDTPSCDERPRAFVHDASSLVLVHAQKDKVAREITRLRGAADYRLLDESGERIGGAEIICNLISEEGLHVAERSGTGTQHVRVRGRIDQLIELGGVEDPAIA